MARDDLHVLVYKVLSYLYDQIKAGEPVDERKINARALRINEDYWFFIMQELHQMGYVRGYTLSYDGHGKRWIDDLNQSSITFKGIEYLTDDKFMQKVREESVY